jgi:hypothetical protein
MYDMASCSDAVLAWHHAVTASAGSHCTAHRHCCTLQRASDQRVTACVACRPWLLPAHLTALQHSYATTSIGDCVAFKQACVDSYLHTCSRCQNRNHAETCAAVHALLHEPFSAAHCEPLKWSKIGRIRLTTITRCWCCGSTIWLLDTDSVHANEQLFIKCTAVRTCMQLRTKPTSPAQCSTRPGHLPCLLHCQQICSARSRPAPQTQPDHFQKPTTATLVITQS